MRQYHVSIYCLIVLIDLRINICFFDAHLVAGSRTVVTSSPSSISAAITSLDNTTQLLRSKTSTNTCSKLKSSNPRVPIVSSTWPCLPACSSRQLVKLSRSARLLAAGTASLSRNPSAKILRAALHWTKLLAPCSTKVRINWIILYYFQSIFSFYASVVFIHFRECQKKKAPSFIPHLNSIINYHPRLTH